MLICNTESLYGMLPHDSYKFELRIETKFEVCDGRIFIYLFILMCTFQPMTLPDIISLSSFLRTETWNFPCLALE